MPNKNPKLLDYIDDHGQHKTALLDNVKVSAEVNGIPIGTHDPEWSVVNQGGPYEFLAYTGCDGGKYQTKVHAKVQPDGFTFGFSSKHIGQHNDHDGPFSIRDHDNKCYHVTVKAVPKKLPPDLLHDTFDVEFILNPA